MPKAKRKTKSNPPLAGLRILDLTRLLPGPMCTLFLADLGAEVIKVEEPGQGDPARYHPPLKKQVSSAFLLLNRNKKSVTLDLTEKTDRARFYALVKKSDVVVEGFRPGAAKRLGVDFASLRKKNPRLIYCSLTGYGQTGAKAEEPGHDINYLALSGVLEQLGPREKPAQGNFQIADLAGALVGAVGILSALYGKKRKARHVDVSLLESALALAAVPFSAWAAGKAPVRGGDILSGGVPAYNIYPTQDGKFLALGALEPKFWESACTALQKPEWRKLGLAGGEAGEKLIRELTELFRSQPQSHWLKIFQGHEACLSPVWDFSEAQEFLKARGTLFTANHPTEGPHLQLRSPVRMSGFEFAAELPAPALGEHNRDILKK